MTGVPEGATKARAFGRSIGDFGELNNAEKEIIAAAREGQPAVFGDTIPETPEDRKKATVRAELVRFLALGGDDATPVHEKGVMILGAIVEGELDLQGCTLVGDLVLLTCELVGELALVSARARTIDLGGTRCDTILADRLEVSGGLYLREGFVARGLVRLPGARIGGSLECDGGYFGGQNKDGDGLMCDSIEARGGVFLRNGFTAVGTVRLPGAKVARLDCSKGHFGGRAVSGHALRCDSIEIGENIELSNGFRAAGVVWLVGAKIGGDLNCRNGHFDGHSRRGGLVCEGIVCKTVFLNMGFVAFSTVNLLGARIGGDVVCVGGIFSEVLTTEFVRKHSVSRTIPDMSVDLSRAAVAGTLWLAGYGEQVTELRGGVDLTGTRVGRIVDRIKPEMKADALDVPARSPAFLRLDGLTYDRFGEETDVSGSARIAFLRLQEPSDLETNFKPQPWEQMIKVLRDMGHVNEARAVAVEKQRALRQGGKITGIAGFLHDAYGLLYGYGYRPLRLATWALAFAMLSALIFQIAADNGVMAPTDRRILDDPQYVACRQQRLVNWTKCDALQYRYTVFNPLLYSLELILPVAGSQQTKDWAPLMVLPCAEVDRLGICQRFVAGDASSSVQAKPGFSLLGIATTILARLENLFGWLAGLMFVAVASGLIKKD
jgi:hypothetical protein